LRQIVNQIQCRHILIYLVLVDILSFLILLIRFDRKEWTNGLILQASRITYITMTMKKILFAFLFFLFQNLIAQTGLPIWPLSPTSDEVFQFIDWRDFPPTPEVISPTSFPFGSIGAAFNGCGDLVFYALHTGTNQQDNLFIFKPDTTPLLSTTTANGPGLNGVKGNQELQVIRVPETPDEWYIIYSEWSSDAGAPNGDAIFRAAKMLYSRVQSDGNSLTVLQRDVALVANGMAPFYNDGKAVSPNANGDENAHFLYATRRSENNPNLSIDKYLITNTGISFVENTGNINVGYWDFTHSESPVELSADGQKLALINRNQSDNEPDVILFNTNNFTAANAELIYLQDLFLVSDGETEDQSDTLFFGGVVEDIAGDTNLEFQWMQNIQHRVSNLEWSPNGEFLYLTGGGFSTEGFSHLTYLMQINLNTNPRELRLQVQETPGGGYNILTGEGCSSNNAGCNNLWRSIRGIQTSYDGKIYFVKTNDNTFYVIPNPDELMPQNIVPSDINLGTADDFNIATFGGIKLLPDQIDGFDYLAMTMSFIDTLTTDTFACPGSSIMYEGNEIFAGDTLYLLGNLEVCDTILEIIVNPFMDANTSEELTICAGETVDIFGEEIGTSGSYEMDFISEIGCDSSHMIVLNVLPDIVINFDITPTCLDENSGELSATVTGGSPPYSYDWSTGANTSSINELSIDTYTLTVTDANNCTREENADIGLTGASGFAVETMDVSCFGDTDGSLIILTQNEELSFSLDGISYSQNSLFSNLPPDEYTVYVQDAAGCIYLENVVINEPDLLAVALPQDTLLDLGDSLVINPILSRDDSLRFLWTPSTYLSCDTCLQTVSTPFQSIVYTLTAQDTFGCSAAESMQISVNNQREIFMPNAFSPNFDGVNDLLYPFGNESVVQINSFRVYDRWGNLLHDKNNFLLGDNDFAWDGFFNGKRMQTGLYVYVLEVAFIDGETVIFKGDVSLLP